MVLQSQYDHIISMYDFPTLARQQNWGIPDAIYYQKNIEDLEIFTTPFFLTTYNISTHPPYDVPEIKEKNYENAISYSDKCLGGFVKQLKISELWDNTLLIITSDHGVSGFGSTAISNPLLHQISMLWIGGLIDTSFVNETMGMQTDLIATLVQQFGWKHNANPFSQNLFGNSSHAFYFSTNSYGVSLL